METHDQAQRSSRRDILASAAALGAAMATTALARTPALADAQAAGDDDSPTRTTDVNASATPRTEVTDATIAEAEKLAGIAFTPAERAQIAKSVNAQVALFTQRAALAPQANSDAPAQVFRVLLPGESPRLRGSTIRSRLEFTGAKAAPRDDADIDFATVRTLGAWLRSGAVTSRRLVGRSLTRLRAVDPTLRCTITLVEDAALLEADACDAELRAGRNRGPLHGIPYGLKDLFDTADIRTTWGAEPWRARVPARDATVVTRLRDAGAVLVAKTAVGALAYGDIWFGGTCRNPWNPEQGSSGSSAGSASAVAAGCVPFAIGTETLGSIVSPCVRCGTTGLRPTFGRVARDGCMALCWSWDKIGPITRSVLDTGIVLEAINGASVADPSSIEEPFAAPSVPQSKDSRVGFDPRWFEGSGAASRDVLDALRAIGVDVIEIDATPPFEPSIVVTSLMAEAAAAFEELTRSGADDQLSWQADEAWPNSFRRTWFVPAIELVQADRLRRALMRWMREVLRGVDALVLPPFAGGMLVATNATGHPALCLRVGFDDATTPRSITLVGHPFEEARLVEIGAALEQRLDVATRRPPMEWENAAPEEAVKRE
jgi:Asp-tRNA(Asn)/Glu-tRNA(Gln) amidotransferase A subunit family amidase